MLMIVRSIHAPDAGFEGIHARNRTRRRHGGRDMDVPGMPVQDMDVQDHPCGTTLQRRCNQSFPHDRKHPMLMVSVPSPS